MAGFSTTSPIVINRLITRASEPELSFPFRIGQAT